MLIDTTMNSAIAFIDLKARVLGFSYKKNVECYRTQIEISNEIIN